MSLEHLHRFEGLIDDMIVDDREISLFEFILRRIVHDRLSNASLDRLADPTKEKRPKRDEIRHAVSVVLSAMAAVATRDADTVTTTVKQSSREAGHEPSLRALPAEQRDLEHFEYALVTLRRTGFEEQRRALNALEICIKYDRILTLPETELFRAVTISLDCPIPIQALPDDSGHLPSTSGP